MFEKRRIIPNMERRLARFLYAGESVPKGKMMENSKIRISGSNLYDIESGKLLRFEPMQVKGRGWTVAKVIGSLKTGRTIEIEEDFRDCNYTLHQAQMACENYRRGLFIALQMQSV
jgi:hypothetical protein